MHQTLLVLHSINRWLVLLSLIYGMFISSKGYLLNKQFTRSDNLIRHLTATISHVQLMLGIYLYLVSPIVKYDGGEVGVSGVVSEQTFFRIVHISLMLIAVIVITIGSAKAKRMETDGLKFRTMLIWFSIALLIVFIAIPWPFSPLVHRPLFRMF